MANTKKYLSHLLQNTGITPACSEEERAAAEVIAKVFDDHGFTPEIQEFSASGSVKVVQAGLGIVLFVGAVLVGIGGVAGIIGVLLTIAAAVIFTMERMGRPVLSQLGSGGLSQNVVAYHKASGPLASPRNRPVVVVAHYDSPRVDLLSKQPFAAYRPILVKLLPFAMVAPALIAIVRLFPFPDAAKIVLWIIAILFSLIPLANAVAIIANRFVLPYTTGAVCNMSSVAAMLGVMDAVAPYELGEEFPRDMPADEFFAEQQRILEDAIAAAEAAAAAETAYPHETEAESDVEGEESDQAVEGEGIEDNDPFSIVPDDFASDDDVSATGMIEMGKELVQEDAAPSSTVSMDIRDLETADNELSKDETELEELPAEEDVELVDVDVTLVDLSPLESDVEDAEGVDVPEQGELDLAAREVADTAENDAPFKINAEGNVRFGADTIRALGMLPATCVFVYEAEETEDEIEPTAFEVEHEPVTVSFDDGLDQDAPYDEQPIDNDPQDLEASYENEEADEEYFEPEFEEVFEEGGESDTEFDYESEEQTEVDAEGVDGDTLDDEPVEEEDEPAEVEQAIFDEVGTSQFPVAAPANMSAVDPFGGTVAMPVQPEETVDSLMAQIAQDIPVPAPAPAPLQTPQQRLMSIPSTADAPVPRTPAAANRASLFDLPDPSSAPVDPFAVSGSSSSTPVSEEAAADARSAFTVISSNEPDPYVDSAVFDRIETISAPAPAPEKSRGLSRFFGRKKKKDDSMGEWLGVDDGFDAKSAGSNIGSWDNFDDDEWKGGAAGFDGASEEELREAITDMGDDELLGHDIWFVATGASENNNAGIRAFLEGHRAQLRGVFLINLESVGAGQVAALSTEGERRVLKGDKRITKLVQRVSSDFHHQYGTVDMPYVTTDAHVAMDMSLRSLTLAGVDATGFALSHTEDDQPYNVDLENVAIVSDVVTEVIRRS